MNKNKVVSILLLYCNTVAFVSWLILSLGFNREDSVTAFLAGSVIVGIVFVSPLAAIRLLRTKTA